ncbi:MAG: hypothetical protein KKB50_11980 [Planctomycetes bacterium]|nr:hypothetical protein [Planctomycetota bacterium]
MLANTLIRHAVAASLMLCLFATASSAAGQTGAYDAEDQRIYWTDTGDDTIKRAQLDGSQVETLIATGLNSCVGIAVDTAAAKMYWVENGLDKIERANPDGGGRELLVSNVRTPVGIALYLPAGKMYWIDSGKDTISRANLDGSDIETIVAMSGTMYSIALDPVNERLCWGFGYTLKRADLDGQNIKDVFNEPGRIGSIAIDWIDEKIYWTNVDEDFIARINFDGSGREELVQGLGHPTDAVLNLPEGRLYSTDQNLGIIQRARINPFGEVETLYSGPPGPAGLAIQFTVAAGLDIRPGSCPNPLNVRSRGVLPVAIVGTASFDVTHIDRGPIELARADGVGGSVFPLNGPPGPRMVVKDVATPFGGEPCECHELTGDGLDDRFLKFSTEDLVAALESGDLPTHTELRLRVSGLLLDQTPFQGQDCVLLLTPNPDHGGSAHAADVEVDTPAEAAPAEY